MEAGREFEKKEVDRIKQRYPGWYIRAPKYFTTRFGGRLLDACAYTSWQAFVVAPNYPRICWEVKSSASAASDYFKNKDMQYAKDRWLTQNYGFPISVLWVPCVNPADFDRRC